MKTSRYTEAQIIGILRQAEGGVPVAELCRDHGMSCRFPRRSEPVRQIISTEN